MSFKIAGRPINPRGFGMASLAFKPNEDAIPVLKAALTAGANFWNAGTIYGTPDRNTLHLLHAYFTKYPSDADKVVISVKSCLELMTGKTYNDAQGIKDNIDNCLRILDRTCRIDLFEPSRLDPNVPIEETVGAMAEYVQAGKIGSIGLSECSATSIRKANAVHPLAAVELEASLFSTEIFSDGIVDVCQELGIPIIAYSPLGKGILTGQLRSVEDVPEKDYMRMFFPRFQPEAFDANMEIVDKIDKIAEKKGVTSAQVALAWVAAQGDAVGVPVLPIPGTSSIARVQENTVNVRLEKSKLDQLDQMLKDIEVKGERGPARFKHMLLV